MFILHLSFMGHAIQWFGRSGSELWLSIFPSTRGPVWSKSSGLDASGIGGHAGHGGLLPPLPCSEGDERARVWSVKTLSEFPNQMITYHLWRFPKIGVPPVIIRFDGISPYKPSIRGYPHLWKAPYPYCNYHSYWAWPMAVESSLKPPTKNGDVPQQSVSIDRDVPIVIHEIWHISLISY